MGELEIKIFSREILSMAVRYACLPTVEENANYTHKLDRALRNNHLRSKAMQEQHAKATARPVFLT